LIVYLGQRVWPDYLTFANIETGFMDVMHRVGGMWLFMAMGALLVIANVGAGMNGQVGGARLLFGMGRDGVLPRKIFGYLDPRRRSPSYNIWIIGVLAFMGAQVLGYELTAELMNFGSFLSFMGVNLAALRQLYFIGEPGRQRRFVTDALFPALGFLFCTGIWLSLPTTSKILGALWFLAGFIYDAVKSRGFRTAPVMIDFSES
jgi:amino acid transporter